MTAIKENSTQNLNKQVSITSCPVTYVMSKIGGYWKPIILYHLSTGQKRYSELKRAIPEITEKMLIQHLKQLQQDNLVIRTAEPVVPPFVTYSLTQSAMKLQAVLNAMAIWGLEEMQGKNQQA